MQHLKPTEEADFRNWQTRTFAKSGSDIFQKAYDFLEADVARQMNIYPYFYPLDSNDGPLAYADGKPVIMLGSNNYLGLTIHPEVRAAAAQAVVDYGTSMTGSRFLNGSLKLHAELEDDLADFFGKQAGLVFATGYQANIGVMSGLGFKNDALIFDEANHGSLYDGGRVGRAEIHKYAHNNMVELERILSTLPAEQGKLVVVDGVFSMEGDVANFPEIAALCKKYEARLVVDDAHGLGVIGRGGRGTASHFGLDDDADLIVGTFSKSMASIGGFVVGEAKVVDFIKHFGRSMIFSASLAPPNVAAAKKALEILRREPERVERLKDNGDYLRKSLQDLGFNTGASVTPIVPIIIGDEIQTLSMWRQLMDAGVYVNSAVTPAVPKGHATLRTSVTSEHTREHLNKALDVFAQVKKDFGL